MDQFELNIISRLLQPAGHTEPIDMAGWGFLYFTASRWDLDQHINISLHWHNCRARLP